MAYFICDDQRIERLLAKLEKQVLEGGAWISPDARIFCEDGNLSVRSSATAEPGKVLISLPEACLLPTDGMALRVSGDRLQLPSSPRLTAYRRAIFDTMLELYNATGKIAQHRRSSPWLALAAEPKTLHRIAAGRRLAPAVARMAKLFDAGKFDELAAESFLKNRVLGFKSGQGKSVPVVMPFIDFMNHHPGAAGFRSDTDVAGRRGLAVYDARPVEGSDECFVRYGFYDAYDILLVYGYVEPAAPFVRSIPMKLDIDGIGSIEVHSRIDAKFPEGKLPQHLAAVRRFMPMVGRGDGNSLLLSHLLIPAGEPAFALRRVLAELIRLLRPNLDPIGLNVHVARTEASVISRNIEFYETLLRDLDGTPSTPPAKDARAMVRRMAQIQLAKLHAYQNTAGGGKNAGPRLPGQ